MNNFKKPMPKIMWLVILGLVLWAVEIGVHTLIDSWVAEKAIYSRNSARDFQAWYYYFGLQFRLEDFLLNTRFYYKSLGYMGLVYVLNHYFFPLYDPLGGFLRRHPVFLIRTSAALFLLYPSRLLTEYFWSNLGDYETLWWGLFYFILCLVYLGAEAGFLRLYVLWPAPQKGMAVERGRLWGP